ncbi:zinc finger protein 22-like, partial [Rhincodon typus]|uniref:zinc finger protein 22-like n=1 Tax=Rhincodon typus TaxID=259920 RepID=UPI00202F63DF
DIRRRRFSNAPSHQDLMESPILSQMEHDQILNLEVKSSIHTGEKLLCREGFTRSSSLLERQLIHTDKRPFQSPDCGKSFRTSRNLMSRQLARINERPFKCQDCGKCYKTSGNLVSHQHVHTKERPFKC